MNAAIARDPAASHAIRVLQKHGEVHVVGGAVRDLLLGHDSPKDVDLLVRGIEADKVETLLNGNAPGRAMQTGKSFGVIRYRHRDGSEVEVALPRTETSTGAGHRDFEVAYDPALSLEDDLLRRDFTCNAIAWNTITGEITDPYGGARDIEAGVLRCVSPRAFPEDPLRILRALRAHARHGLDPDTATMDLMREHAASLRHLAPGRIGEELISLIGTARPAAGITLARRTQVLEQIIPDYADDERAATANRRLLTTSAVSADPNARLASLFSCTAHPDAGARADAARVLLSDLKLPNRTANGVAHLVRHTGQAPAVTPEAARRLISSLGRDDVDAFIAVRHGMNTDPSEVAELRGVISRGEATSIRELAVVGPDLIAAGIAPGPALGEALRGLLAQVIVDPSVNTKETLISLLPAA
ncbi:CCA tRNA nucleotidyltransferase [Miltoncostaea oceani]|uniref:CCA tRNA nucleotidyltransferase n=1 Tax=Miltoncostaea oceani TaxID=2843216 RepID=UPI001C3D67FF|nr:hypothetical protein [Miltoncostaea oceani]